MYIREQIIAMYDSIIKLKDGINPITNKKLMFKRFINIRTVERILGEIAEYIGSTIPKETLSFKINIEDTIENVCDNEEISISKLVYRINRYNNFEFRLYARDITEWLYDNGYLDTSEEGSIKKIPTEKLMELGVKRIIQKNDSGFDYAVNVYNRNAQEFIIRHLSVILCG